MNFFSLPNTPLKGLPNVHIRSRMSQRTMNVDLAILCRKKSLGVCLRVLALVHDKAIQPHEIKIFTPFSSQNKDQDQYKK